MYFAVLGAPFMDEGGGGFKEVNSNSVVREEGVRRGGKMDWQRC